MFPNKKWTLGGLKTLLRKIDATDSVERRSGSGLSRTVCVPDVIANVQDLVLSQENTQQSTADFTLNRSFTGVLSTELFARTCIWHALRDAGRKSWRMPTRSLDDNAVAICWSAIRELYMVHGCIRVHIDCRLGSAIFFYKNCPQFSKDIINNRSWCFFMEHSVVWLSVTDVTDGVNDWVSCCWWLCWYVGCDCVV